MDDLFQRFQIGVGVDGQEFLDMLLQYMQRLREEQHALIEATRQAGQADEQHVAAIRAKSSEIAKVEGLVKSLARGTLEEAEASRQVAQAERDRIQSLRDMAAEQRAAVQLAQQKAKALAESAREEADAVESLAKQRRDALSVDQKAALERRQMRQRDADAEVEAEEAVARATADRLKADQEANRLLESLAKDRAEAEQRAFREQVDLDNQRRKLTGDILDDISDETKSYASLADAAAMMGRRTVDAFGRKAEAEVRAKVAADDMAEADRRIAAAQADLAKGTTVERVRELNAAMAAGARAAAASANADDDLRQATVELDEAIKAEGATAVAAAQRQQEADAKAAAARQQSIAQRRAEVEGDEKARQSKMAYARSILFVSQAAEDAMYGPAAVLNNIPLVFTSIAQATGKSYDQAIAWAGAASVVGTAAIALGPKIAALWGRFTDPQAKEAGTILQSIETQLARLKETEWFIHVDKKDVDEIEARLRSAKAAMEAFQRAASGRTEVQQAQAKVAMEAVVEKAGGTDEESGALNLRRAMMAVREAHPEAFRGDEDFTNLRSIRDKIGVFEGNLRDPNVPFEAKGNIARSLDMLKRRRDQILDRIESRDENTIGGFVRGDEDERKILQKFLDFDPETFQQFGVGAEFREAVGEAERSKIQKEVETKRFTGGKTQKELEAEARDKQSDIEKKQREAREREQKRLEQIARDQTELEQRSEADTLKHINDQKRKQEDDASRARDKEVNRLAALTERGLKFSPPDSRSLDAAIANRMQGGMEPGAVIDDLLPQMVEKAVAPNPNVPEDMREAVARRALQNRVDRVGAVGGDAMLDRIGDLDARDAERARVQDRRDLRRPMNEFRQDLSDARFAGQMADQGRAMDFAGAAQQANPMLGDTAALGIGRRAATLEHTFGDTRRALMQAMMEFQRGQLGLEREFQGLRNDVNRLMFHQQNGSRVQSNLRVGMRRR